MAGVASGAFLAAGVEVGLTDLAGVDFVTGGLVAAGLVAAGLVAAGLVAASLTPALGAVFGAAFGAGLEALFATGADTGFATGALFFPVIVCPPFLRSLRQQP